MSCFVLISVILVITAALLSAECGQHCMAMRDW